MIIFIDFDGVFNNTEMDWFSPEVKGDAPYIVDPENYRCFQELVISLETEYETKCEFVISSTWRKTTDREYYVNRFGPWFAERLHSEWRTAEFPRQLRGLDVRDWLDQNIKENVWSFRDYIILDDDTDFIWSQPLVHIDHHTGLTMDHVVKALEISRTKRV